MTEFWRIVRHLRLKIHLKYIQKESRYFKLIFHNSTAFTVFLINKWVLMSIRFEKHSYKFTIPNFSMVVHIFQICLYFEYVIALL